MKNEKIIATLINLMKTKTVWVNLIGAALQIVNSLTGEVIPVQTAIIIQAVLNAVVRLITDKPVIAK